jgi:hypothetical protein
MPYSLGVQLALQWSSDQVYAQTVADAELYVRDGLLGPEQQLLRATASEKSYSRLSFCWRRRLTVTEKHFVPPERS